MEQPNDPKVIQPRDTKPIEPTDPNPVAFTCTKCGLKVQQIMSYSCPQSNCPVGLGSNTSL